MALEREEQGCDLGLVAQQLSKVLDVEEGPSEANTHRRSAQATKLTVSLYMRKLLRGGGFEKDFSWWSGCWRV